MIKDSIFPSKEEEDKTEQVSSIQPKWLTSGEGGDRKKTSTKNEKRFAEKLGGRRTSRSGAKKWSKYYKETEGNDVETTTLLIEHKGISKDTKSLSIKREWLEQIISNAKRGVKDPAMAFTFEKASIEDWLMLPLSVAERLLKDKK